MLKQILIITGFLMWTQPVISQHENGLVNWLTFKEAQEKYKEVQKPIIIDFYTDWCGWCKHMMKTTYSNPGLAAYINQNFYAVKFDAETKDTIEYNGKVYKPLSPAPRTAHELTIKFLGNKLSYPSTVFVTNNYEYNLLIQGYLEDKKIEPLLIFMLENVWQTTSYDEFGARFQNAFYDTAFPKIPVKVYTIQEVEKLQKKQPKKILFNIGTDFCNSGRVMTATSFVDTSVAKYINKHFYLVNFNATSQDTVVFQGVKYYNTVINNFPVHQLCLKFSNERLVLPTLAVLDEQFKTIDALAYYQSPQRLKPILSYFGSNAYKNRTFNEFMQEYLNPPAPKPPAKKK